MTIVLDSSLVVSALTDTGAEGTWSETVLTRHPLAAPHLLHAEVTNVLRRLSAAGEITEAVASFARRELTLLRVELYPFTPFADRVWELRSNVTSYDAWYVALAESLEAPLATLDGPLTRSPGPRCTFLVPDDGGA